MSGVAKTIKFVANTLSNNKLPQAMRSPRKGCSFPTQSSPTCCCGCKFMLSFYSDKRSYHYARSYHRCR